jgi:probable HAF family extracellular repeat protein
MTDLHGLIAMGGLFSSAISINSSGHIVGAAEAADGNLHAFVLAPGAASAIDLHSRVTFGGNNSIAYAISDNGMVVGCAEDANGRAIAFFYDLNTSSLRSLGAIAGESAARAVNSLGQAAGETDMDSTGASNRAFRIPPNTQISPAGVLGTFGGLRSTGLGINSLGQLVGSAEDDGASAHAFVYDTVNGMQDLETLIPANSRWFFFSAEAINDAGQIVGTGLFEGYSAGFLLTPIAPPDTTPPVITSQVTGTLGSEGWYRSNTAVNWSVTDPESSITSTSGCGPVTLAADTTGSNLTCSATNGAGLSNSGAVTIRIDKTAPTVSVGVPSNNGIHLLNSSVASNYSCNDATSGLQSCSGSVPNGTSINTTAAGSFNFVVNATDKAGNTAQVANPYSIRYSPAGAPCRGEIGHAALQPINSDGSSVFRQGSTIPIKFRVCDANGVSIGTPGVVSGFELTQVVGTTTQVVNETSTSVDAEAAFRWDAANQQWIRNLSTKDLPSGQTYVYRIRLNDTTSIGFQFGLR